MHTQKSGQSPTRDWGVLEAKALRHPPRDAPTGKLATHMDAQTRRGCPWNGHLKVDVEDCVGAPLEFRHPGLLTQPGSDTFLTLKEQH